MSLITNKQQELIDQAISNYIKSYDKFALQYLNVRNDIFDVSSKISKELSETNTISEDNKAKVYQLQFELDKVEEIYKLHLNNLSKAIDIKQKLPPPYIDELNSQFDSLLDKKETLQREIRNIKDVQKPLLDDMRTLMKSFDTNLNSRSARRTNKTIIQELGLDADGVNESKQIDVKSLVFTYDELKILFDDVDLNQLKTDDNKETEDISNQSLNIIRYLDDQLENGRAFQLLENDKYLYDVSKSLVHDTDSVPTIDEYDKMIKSLTTNIKDLVDHGAEAKERWSTNAKKLEIIKEALKQFDEITGALADVEME